MHSQALIYYCATCEKSICSDCAMFGDDHKEHRFEHLEKVYEQHLQSIRSESEFVHARAAEYAKHMERIKRMIETIQRAKDDKVEELMRVKRLVQEKLEEELKEKLMVLFSEKSVVGDEIKYLKGLQKDVEKEISFSTRSQLVLKSQELVKKIVEARARPELPIEDIDVSPEFSYSCAITLALK